MGVSQLIKLGPLIDEVAGGLFSKAIKKTQEAFTANAHNDLNKGLFYGLGGPIGHSIGAAQGLVKTVISTAEEFINPFARKLREETGVSVKTQSVLKNKLKLLDSKKAQKLRDRVAEVRALKADENKIIKALTKESDSKKILDLELKQLDVQELKELKKLTKKEEDFYEVLTDAEKAMQGQQNYQFLENSQQGKNSKWLQERIGQENYYRKSDFTLEDYIDTKNIKSWETEGVVSDSDMTILFDRIVAAQGDALEKGKNIQMFVKEDMSSRAAGQLRAEINSYRAAKNNAVYKSLAKRDKGFESTEELSDFFIKSIKDSNKYKKLPKEEKADMLKFDIIDNKLWFGDTHLSGAYELGGVNTQNFIKLDGTMVSVVNDVNDIFKFSMPGGDVGITVSIPYVRNALKKTVKAKEEARLPFTLTDTPREAFDKSQKLKKEGVAKLLSDDSVPFKYGGAGPDMQSKNQVNIARDIVDYKTAPLTGKEMGVYATKMGVPIGIGTGIGLFQGRE
tara:strand:+ start:4194 stop:5717 length:1524 start_codon:yes stop_codon:yes gene_type:complete